MNEENKPNKMRLGEQLPKHSADPASWQRLSEKLDMLDAEASFTEKLQHLPVHTPDQGMWAVINQRLTRAAWYRTGIRIALSAAAGFLLLFTVSRITNFELTSPSTPPVAKQELPGSNPNMSNSANPATSHVAAEQNLENSATGTFENHGISTVTNEQAALNANQKYTKEMLQTEVQSGTSTAGSGNIFTIQQSNLMTASESGLAVIDLSPIAEKNFTTEAEPENTIRDVNKFMREILNTPVQYNETHNTMGLSANQLPQPGITSTPKDPESSGKSHFALDMGYFPENIYNGTDNSLFHNVDLTASLNKEKVRFNTSVGMTYNEEQFEIYMNYDIKSPVTAIGPGGHLDTLSYNSASLQSDYVGSEKHQYFTYNLGIGRRLFSFGKFTTWLNAGAGFGIMLNNPDLVAKTENSVNKLSNVKITDISTSKPVYNDVNVNFVTGIDFSYKIVQRLSISFTPTSRWYFKPVLSKNNQPTDELTLGFKTGIKFNF